MTADLQTRRMVGAPLAWSPRHRDDFYATEGAAVLALARVERLPRTIWEPCCGAGDLARPLEGLGHRVIATDLVRRGHGAGGVDFLRTTRAAAPAVLTNPPYRLVVPFIAHALGTLRVRWLALFLRFGFYPAARDGLLDRHPPARLWCFTWRVKTGRGGVFSKRNGMFDFAWFIWIAGHTGPTTLHRLHKEVLERA